MIFYFLPISFPLLLPLFQTLHSLDATRNHSLNPWLLPFYLTVYTCKRRPSIHPCSHSFMHPSRARGTTGPFVHFQRLIGLLGIFADTVTPSPAQSRPHDRPTDRLNGWSTVSSSQSHKLHRHWLILGAEPHSDKNRSHRITCYLFVVFRRTPVAADHHWSTTYLSWTEAKNFCRWRWLLKVNGWESSLATRKWNSGFYSAELCGK